MKILNISLFQFKNYKKAQFHLKAPIIGISGNNGQGKTNLLDAIYYSCFTHSYFSKSDQNNVLKGTLGFRIDANFELKGQYHQISAVLRENGKKEFSWDEETYVKFSHHIGKIPAVMICPDDVNLITEGSEVRRKYLDALISQIEPSYLQHLIEYTKVLQQRNSLLKNSFETKNLDHSLLDIYDAQLIVHGQPVFEARENYFQKLQTLAYQLYHEISGADEKLELKYESQLQRINFESLLKSNRDKDRYSLRTNGGIHKDDLIFSLDDFPFKNRASQGQRKSLLFALKLAEYEILKKAKSFPPLLLMDDIFEKLDANRMFNLLKKVCLQPDGQVFITDTHKERIHQHFDTLGIQYQMIHIEDLGNT